MSYSFSIRAANKQVAKDAVARRMAEVVNQQPTHARDLAAVVLNANTVIELMNDDPTKDVVVTCTGYLSWHGGTESEECFVGANMSCSANYTARD
jgi:hypothetical protein